jgi:hypothetical protein
MKLRKNYRGLPKGTEFVYNADLDAWSFSAKNEDISDNSYASNQIKVQFSDSFVQDNPEIFELPEKKLTAKERRIIALEKELKLLKGEE